MISKQQWIEEAARKIQENSGQYVAWADLMQSERDGYIADFKAALRRMAELDVPEEVLSAALSMDNHHNIVLELKAALREAGE